VCRNLAALCADSRFAAAESNVVRPFSASLRPSAFSGRRADGAFGGSRCRGVAAADLNLTLGDRLGARMEQRSRCRPERLRPAAR
jgi:hypothetical protein